MTSRAMALLGLCWLLLASGCAKKAAAPAIPELDPKAERRAQLFGLRAAAADIVWRSSGLGVRILTPGEGVAPRTSDTVRVHYTGTLRDGMVFDDSRVRGKPEDFVVSRLIPGWAAAMSALKPGGRAEVFVPPALGYGARKVASVPANLGLIFDVELIAVNPTESRSP